MSKKSDTDYTLNKDAARNLCERIEKFWHSRGYIYVLAYPKAVIIYDTAGNKVGTRYEIKSNIKQSVSSLERGHIL